ncbi:hypothetical protein RF11_12573 [Thelohanellus kitauei]|uniref:Uncharacterized protein n=1 Tax=Thelohanellus kitauei TaxID=669202 RepID=A0A0C2NEF8_THEKT|nr:hypothetical protein RF11_12573 [Thelohanellus kitauei]
MEAISSDNYTFLDSKIENLLNNLKCQDNLGFAQDYFDPELLSASDIQIANHRVRRYCLIATDTNNNSELKKTLKLEGYDENFSQFLIDELDRYGYACIEYRRSSTDCTQLGNKIAEKHHELTKTYFHFQVIKVYRYFFMNLAPQLISLIHELCSLKSKLARTLTNYLSNENSFLSTFVQNENKLWKHFRFLVLKRLLIIFFSFEEGKRQIADFYLQNFSKIYHLSLPDSFGSVYSLLKLSVEFTTDHYIIKYLFGNRLLCNIIDAMSKIVKTIVLKYGEQSTISNMEIDRILLVGDSFLRFLSIDLKIESCFSEFEPELKREGDRIILLCLEFDTYEFSFDNYFTLNDSRLPQIIFKLQEILVKFIQWLCLDLKTLEGILRKQLREFKRIITSNPSEVEDLTYRYDIQNQARFILSRIFFINLLVFGAVNHNLSQKMNNKILRDEKMLLWVAQPVMQSLSYRFTFNSDDCEETRDFDRFINFFNNSSDIPLINIQTLYILQILVSKLCPNLFVKHLLFSIFPILHKTPNLEEINQILLKIRQTSRASQSYLLIIIFNTLYERLFMWNEEKLLYSLIEKWIIHYLALGDKQLDEIVDCLSDHFSAYQPQPECISKIIERVSCVQNHQNSSLILKLKPEYYKKISP